MRWIREVVEGSVPAPRLVRLACQRHLRDLQEAEERGWRYDEGRADWIVDFYLRFLRHGTGRWGPAAGRQGAPFALAPWQEFVVRNLFGWVSVETGRRRFRTAYLEIPKKAGKSVFAASLGLVVLLLDGEPGAEVYCAATVEQQAMIVHRHAKALVKASPALKKRLNVRQKRIVHEASESFFAPLGRNSDGFDGVNPLCAVVDEYHRHPSTEILDVLHYSAVSRDEPLVVIITTAGEDLDTPCGAEHDYAVEVLEASEAGAPVADSHFALIAAADAEDLVDEATGRGRWDEPELWAKVHPGVGVTIDVARLKEMAEKARRSESGIRSFKRYYLNAWQSGEGTWMPRTRYDATTAPRPPDEVLAAAPCWVGLDLADTLDLCGGSVVWPPASGLGLEHWWMESSAWLPEENLAEVEDRARGAPLREWAAAGHITLTPGNLVDQDFIEAWAREIADRYQVRELVVDRWNARPLTARLSAAGLTVVEFGQGYKDMSPAVRHTDELFRTGALRHGPNPVQRWCYLNVIVSRDAAGNVKPDKKNRARKIDLAVAGIMAVGRASVAPPRRRSRYRDAGIVVAGATEETNEISES